MSFPVKSQSRAAQESPTVDTSSDDLLMIDVDFFDDRGRWNPRKLLFSAREDTQRSQSLWTRLFGGIMALQGKIWAKNFLKNHFGDRPEARQLLENIRKKGHVSASEFFETAASCSFRYLDLGALQKNPDQRESLHGVFDAYLKDIDLLTFNHISQIDWSKIDDHFFPKINLTIAKNIAAFVNRLEVDPVNEPFIYELEQFADRYLEWMPFPGVARKSSGVDTEPQQTAVDSPMIDPGEADAIERIMSSALRKYRQQQTYATSEKTVSSFETSGPAKPDVFLPPVQQIQDVMPVDTPASSAEANLVSIFDDELSRVKAKGLQYSSQVWPFFSCKLIEYFRIGSRAFDASTDFLLLQKIIDMPADDLRSRLEFLSDQQFYEFLGRLTQLEDRLPAIRAGVARRAAISSVMAGQGYFDAYDDVDADKILALNLGELDDFGRVSEADAKKIERWITSLGSGVNATQHEDLIRGLLTLAEQIDQWLHTIDAKRFNKDLHRRLVILPIRISANRFLKQMETGKISFAIKEMLRSTALDVTERIVFVRFSHLLLDYALSGPIAFQSKDADNFKLALEPSFRGMIEKAGLIPLQKEALLDLIIRLRKDMAARGL